VKQKYKDLKLRNVDWLINKIKEENTRQVELLSGNYKNF